MTRVALLLGDLARKEKAYEANEDTAPTPSQDLHSIVINGIELDAWLRRYLD